MQSCGDALCGGGLNSALTEDEGTSGNSSSLQNQAQALFSNNNNGNGNQNNNDDETEDEASTAASSTNWFSNGNTNTNDNVSTQSYQQEGGQPEEEAQSSSVLGFLPAAIIPAAILPRPNNPGSFLHRATSGSTRNATSTYTRDIKDEYGTDIESGSDEEDNKVKATVIMISGCADSQTSADVSNVSNFSLPDPNGKAGGACTSALLQVLYADHNDPRTDLSFAQVINSMRSILAKGDYTQIPQLTSSRSMNVTKQAFFLAPPDCTGTKRAVLIGINYVGQNGELSGCINDCLNMKDYIMNVWGFPEQNITVLLDDGVHPPPTRSNIMTAYKNVARASQSGDAVFCHYSGHGGRIRDDDQGEEADGYDETLIPVDYTSAGQIRDDDLYKTLVCSMPENSTLVSLMDCCHSGSVLDLPYKFRAGSNSGAMTYEPSSSGIADFGIVQQASQQLSKMGLCSCLILVIVVVAAFVLAIVFASN